MKIYFFSNIFTHYNLPLWDKLLKSDFLFFHFGIDNIDRRGIKTVNISTDLDSRFIDKFFKIKNIYIKNYLFWQFGVIYRCIISDFDKAIFLGDFKVLSTWFAVFICKLKGNEVVFWTHGLYGNESKVKLRIRLLFYKLADKLLVYENRGKNLLIANNFNSNKVFVVYNSLNYNVQKSLFFEIKEKKISPNNFFLNDHIPSIVFIGRLTKQKKLGMLIKAILNLNDKIEKYNLLIIGDGPQRKFLENLALPSKNIFFYGESYCERENCNLIFNSDLCVSPGNVGLTAVHSLSYGTPVLTHDNLNNQMPEVGVIKQDFNGGFFKENDVLDLQKQLEHLISIFKNNKNIKSNCRSIIDNKYNPTNQLKIIEKALSSNN